METSARSMVKAVSYRFLGSLSTAAIFYLMTGKGSMALGAGLLDMVVKIAVYFVHERLWDHIDYGRAKPPDYEI